jgi:predicted nucleic acid-binding protein
VRVVAVLDACVLFPAELRDTLLSVAEHGLYRVHWTEKILDEVRRNLIKTKYSTPEKVRYLIEQMETAFEDALVSGYESLIPEMKNDPKDRHVLAAAVSCKAQIIVTSNLRHFRPVALAPHDILAKSPDTFLLSLVGENRELMRQIVLQQANRYRNPPKTFDELLDSLANQLPNYVKQLKERQ